MRGKVQKIRKGPSGASLYGTRLTQVALCGMVCAVPLIYLRDVFGYELVPRFLAFHLCLVLACLGWLLQTRWGRDLQLVHTPLLLPALCFAAVALLSTPATTHLLDSLVELANQAALLVLLFLVANTLPFNRLRPVLWTSAATGLAIALVGILQYHGLEFLDIPSAALPSATFGNRNYAAEYLICAIPLSGLLFLTARRRPALLLSGLSATLMGVFLVYTRTRAAWVGLGGAGMALGGLLAFWPGLRRPILEAIRLHGERDREGLALGFLTLFVLLSVLPASPAVLPETKARVVSTVTSIFQQEEEAAHDQSHTERLATWGNTLRLIADHPLLGVGPGGWKRAYPPYDTGATTVVGRYMNSPHNDYLSTASEYGLIGLGAYLWFLITGFKCLLDAARAPDPSLRVAAPMFALSLLSILGAAFFAFPKEQPQTALFPYLLFGVAAGATARRRIDLRSRGFGPPLLVIFLVISLAGAALSWRRLGFDRHYLRVLYFGKVRGDLPALLTEVQRALEYGVFRPHILVFKGMALQNLGRSAEAETAYRQTLTCAPHAWRAHEGLGYVCLQQGRLQDALAHYQTALSLCPSATYIRNNVGMIYYEMGDPDRAEQEFRAVLRATPNDPETCFNLGSLYQARGRLDSARARYQQALSLNSKMPQAHLALGNVTYAMGRYQEALSAYRSFLSLTPDDTASVRLAGERIATCEEQLKK